MGINLSKTWKIALGMVGLVVLLFLLTYFLPWQKINWGSIQLLPGQTVTVTGEAEKKERSQVAYFSAAFETESEDRDTALNGANKKTDDIIKKIKEFGIAAEDIETTGANVYQYDKYERNEFGGERTKTAWRVSNSVEITLRDIARVSEFSNLLNRSGATNVYGPNFGLEDVRSVKRELSEEALDDARKKAEELARLSGRKLGKIVSISEGGVSVPVTADFFGYGKGGGEGVTIEPGSKTVAQTLTVVFELK